MRETMKSIKTIHIDKTPDGKLYRYKIQYDAKGCSHGSCFSYESLEEALVALLDTLERIDELENNDNEN